MSFVNTEQLVRVHVPKFELSSETGLRSGFSVKATFVGVAVTGVILYMVYSAYKQLTSERMRATLFPVTSSGYVATRNQCLDTPGHEKCGSSEQFLNTRGAPHVGAVEQELADYYTKAVQTPGDDAGTEHMRGKKSENMGASGPMKLSETSLEGIARGTR